MIIISKLLIHLEKCRFFTNKKAIDACNHPLNQTSYRSVAHLFRQLLQLIFKTQRQKRHFTLIICEQDIPTASHNPYFMKNYK